MATKKIREPKPQVNTLDSFPGATIIVYPGTRDFATLYRACYLGEAIGLDTEDYNVAEQRCIAAWVAAQPEVQQAELPELVPDPATWTAISVEADERDVAPEPIALTATPAQLQAAAAELALAPETCQAIIGARSEALGLPVPFTTWIATAHVSLEQRLELRRGQRGLLVIEVRETTQGYTSIFRREFSDEGEARAWMSDECIRLAGATRAVAA